MIFSLCLFICIYSSKFAELNAQLLANTLGLRSKLFVKVNFFNVDAQRLATGYRQGRQGRKEKKEMLN